jgi:hypothetical protein
MKIFIDVKNKSINFSSNPDEIIAPILDIFFGANKNTEFENPFSFSYKLFDEEKNISENSYPENNVFFASTDQDYLISEHLNIIEPNKSYKISISVIYGKDTFEKDFVFQVGNTGQPFPSWSFDNEKFIWKAPTAMPSDNNVYLWDEKSLSWTSIGHKHISS